MSSPSNTSGAKISDIVTLCKTDSIELSFARIPHVVSHNLDFQIKFHGFGGSLRILMKVKDRLNMELIDYTKQLINLC